MENDPLARLLEQILPDSIDKQGIVRDSLEAIQELANKAAEMIATEPGLLDLYQWLAKTKQYPLLVRGGLPVRDPLRLIDLANQAALVLVRHGQYDEVAKLSNAVAKEPLLIYDAARLYQLGRPSDLENLAKSHNIAHWVLAYIAAMTVSALARGLTTLLETRGTSLEPIGNKCPVCGAQLIKKKCPICGKQWQKD